MKHMFQKFHDKMWCYGTCGMKFGENREVFPASVPHLKLYWGEVGIKDKSPILMVDEDANQNISNETATARGEREVPHNDLKLRIYVLLKISQSVSL